jgi:hypothetical protein
LKAVERKPSKPSPTASPLLFEADPEPLPETLTALGGVSLDHFGQQFPIRRSSTQFMDYRPVPLFAAACAGVAAPAAP